MRARRTTQLEKVEAILVSGLALDGISTEQLTQLREAGLDAKIGFIAHAGRVFDGDFQVQFNEGTTGWSSRWPKWAFQSAREALLYDKKILVIFEGSIPAGNFLLQVLVLPTAA